MSEADRLKHAYGKINKEYGFALATCPPEKDGPIYMVNLMKYHEVAQYDGADTEAAPISGREADDKYNPASVLNKIGADMVFIGDVTGNYMGSEDWDRIAVVRYATRKSFIEMQSRKDFGEKHVHKNAGMQRTVIVCCRPEDTAIDTRERPAPSLELRTVAMIVRQTPQRDAAFAALPEAVNFAAEGTIVSDGRMWDTVQFIPVQSADEVPAIAARIADVEPNTTYVMAVRVTLDAFTSR
jgi:hypothetical protein